MQSYKTVAGYGECEIVINKSRFIGRAFLHQSEEQMLQTLEEINKKHHDATHNCYAYILNQTPQVMRYSDNGEPQGTAGIPMLEVLKKQELVNTLVIVTRYFGGILLGAGGLVRAYSKTTAQAILEAGTVTMQLTGRFAIDCDYQTWGKLENFLRNFDCIIADTAFLQTVTATVLVKSYNCAEFTKQITDIFNARLFARLIAEEFMAWGD